MKFDFVHLHLHSHYSFRDSLVRCDSLAERCCELDYDSVALTDHGHISGWIDFYSECVDRGVKPLLGVEAYFVPHPESDDKRRHLTLIAMNNAGVKNLVKMMSVAGTELFYYVPRVDLKTLEEYSDGVICLSGCSYQGIFGEGLSISSSLSLARKLKSIFGDRFYCEIMPHKFRQQVIANNRACAAATILKINLVTTFDVHYLRAEESKYHDLLMEIQGRDPYTSKEFWFRNKGQVLEYIRLWPERFQRSFIDGAKSTVEIADRCDFEIVFGNFSFPKFEVTLDEGFLKWLEQKNT